MGEIRDFMRWFRRVRDKYFRSKADLLAGLDAAEEIINKADALIPDSIDGKIMVKAKQFLGELREAAEKL